MKLTTDTIVRCHAPIGLWMHSETPEMSSVTLDIFFCPAVFYFQSTPKSAGHFTGPIIINVPAFWDSLW